MNKAQIFCMLSTLFLFTSNLKAFAGELEANTGVQDMNALTFHLTFRNDAEFSKFGKRAEDIAVIRDFTAHEPFITANCLTIGPARKDNLKTPNVNFSILINMPKEIVHGYDFDAPIEAMRIKLQSMLDKMQILAQVTIERQPLPAWDINFVNDMGMEGEFRLPKHRIPVITRSCQIGTGEDNNSAQLTTEGANFFKSIGFDILRSVEIRSQDLRQIYYQFDALAAPSRAQ